MSSLFYEILVAGTALFIAFLAAIFFARLRWGIVKPAGYLLDFLFLLPIGIYGIITWSYPGDIPQAWLCSLIPSTRLYMEDLWFLWLPIIVRFSVLPFPLLYLAARHAFNRVDRDVIDAARMLGMSQWQILFQIMIPSGWPWFVSGLVIATAWGYSSMNDYFSILWAPSILAVLLAMVLLFRLSKSAERRPQ